MSPWRTLAKRMATGPGPRAAIGVLAVVGLLAVLAGALPASSALGSMARGARNVLVIGTGAALVSLLGGVLIGASAAWVGGWWDGLTTRLSEVLMMFPGVMLIALVRAIWPQPSVGLWVVALAMVRVPEVARLTRAEVLRLSCAEFIVAARAMGASPSRLLWRHAGPHLGSALAVSAMFSMVSIVLIDAALSVLGLGQAWGGSSWGALIAQAVDAGYPDGAIAPAAALTVTLLALGVLAEALRKALDPYAYPPTPLRQRPAGSR